jgi:branched-subunit amino acid aminotransferase/4-amino-4-deoxychorismate lyase
VPFLDLHTTRLNDSLNILGIKEVKIDFAKEIKQLLSLNNLENAYIRITAYKKRESTGTIIYVDKFGYYPQSAYEKGFSAVISPYRRNLYNSFYNLKSLSYLENRLSWFEAQKVNKDEALIINEDGFLVGGSRSNLFIVKDANVLTPSLESGAFDGITRKIVIGELKKIKIKVEEKEISLEDLFSCANEAFLTSSLLEIMPLVECDGKALGNGKPGKIAHKLLEQYRSIANSHSATEPDA